jgi:hypothetical protein
MEALSLGLALVLNLAQADTFYLLSQVGERSPGAPLPFNPCPECPTAAAHPGIWLVDDSARSKTAPKFDFKTAQLALGEWVAEQELIAARELKVVGPPLRAVPQPIPTNYYNRTITGIGPTVAILEQIYPGIATNFAPAQLTTNHGNNRLPPRLPAHIDPHSPSFKEDLRQWKIQRGLPVTTNSVEPEIPGSGGGDVFQWPNLLWYKMEIQVLTNPTPNTWAVSASTNETGYVSFVNPVYSPGLTAIYVNSATNPGPVYLTNFTGKVEVDMMDANSATLTLIYPDIVAREANNWLCARLYFSAECDVWTTPFTLTNYLFIQAGKAGAAWEFSPVPSCNALPFNGTIEVTNITQLIPQRWPQSPWPTPYNDPYTPTLINPWNPYSLQWEHQAHTLSDALKPTFLMKGVMGDPSPQRFIFNSADWPLNATVCAEGVTDLHGYVQFTFPVDTNESSGFFYIATTNDVATP